MWTYDNASRLGSDNMDRRAYQCSPSYGAGFEGFNPVGSVLEWTQEPARVQRRRCRSEGLERSPYEHARELRSADGTKELRLSDVNRDRAGLVRQQPSKSHYTINRGSPKQFRHECMLPAENGDYIMSSEKYLYQTGSKMFRKSPTRPLLVTTLSNTKIEDSRLPKVEELLEKADQNMIDEVPVKKPLKSILNNSSVPMSQNVPTPKPNPPGILKKPKSKIYQDPKLILTGQRRQRAASDSDYNCTYQIGSHLVDNRLPFQSSNTKRAKDNTGTGYSYGTAIASLPNQCKSPLHRDYSKSPLHRDYIKARCACKDNVLITNDTMHVLRTTAINSVCETTVDLLPRQETPTTATSAVSPALPVSSVTAVSPQKVKTKKRGKTKVKVNKMKSTSKIECNVLEEGEDAHSRSPSPDPWQMEMDYIIPVATMLNSELKKKEIEPAPKLTPKITNGAPVVPKKLPSKDSPLCIPESVTSCLRPSLFPRVPPYLKFASHDETTPLKMPTPIQKHLKWKLTSITPIVVQKTLTNSGFRLVKSECDTSECPQEETVEWIGIWGKHMKSLLFRAIKDGQKMNHFPGTFQIGRKDRLWRNLQKLSRKYGDDEFGIMPMTYVLPHDMKLLKHEWQKHSANNEKWIIKPPASARGTGIKVVSRWTQIPKKRPVVVQRYVSKPYLINGNKFDMRLYVLVTSVHPLRVYLYKDGLARFASVKYNDEVASLNDRYMHLTNYSINRLSKNYTPNEDFASCEGHKWTLQTLFQYLRNEKCVDTDALWESMKDLVIKTLIAGEASISSLTKANITSRYNCYELFGIDVLLDENLKPWLLEVNISPSLHSASPLDRHVKGPLVSTVLNIAQFQVPIKTNLEMLSKDKPHKLAGLPYDSRLYTVYLSKEERDKHIIYTNMEDRDMYLRDILSTLTPDDVRHLLQAEDELTQAGDMERVFPDASTHKYLGYLAGPRYYNRLFDAWETRYANTRHSGIELLRNLCDIGYHLEVPPVPLKNDIDAPSPPASAPLSNQSLVSLEDPSAEGDPGKA